MRFIAKCYCASDERRDERREAADTCCHNSGSGLSH